VSSLLGGNNALITNKAYLTNGTVLPITADRYIVVEPTRELYYDDGTNRFKLRDIMIVADNTARDSAPVLDSDWVYVKSTKVLYFRNGNTFESINAVSTVITQNDANAISGGAVYTALVGKSTTTDHTITGDGTTTSFEITHTFNSKKLIVQVVDSNYETVYPDVLRSANNKVTVKFKTAPANNVKYYVFINGVVIPAAS